MKVISIYNVKGGVGKTATSVNIAYLASEEKAKVLLIDLDPQGASTFYFKIVQNHNESIKKTFFGKKSLEDSIVETEFKNLNILPADSRYRKLDGFLNDMKNSDKWLKKLLKPVKKEYDYIFIDCPPNITSLSENIFNNVDFILVPVIPTVLSVRTFQQLYHYFKDEKYDRKKLTPFYSMVEKKKNMHTTTMREFSELHPGTINVAIPYHSLVEKMGEYQAPVTYQYSNSESSEAYRELWKKLKQKIHRK